MGVKHYLKKLSSKTTIYKKKIPVVGEPVGESFRSVKERDVQFTAEGRGGGGEDS